MQSIIKNLFQRISSVLISPQGKFKYILIFCEIQYNNDWSSVPIYFVRGQNNLQYHIHIFEKFFQQVKSAGFQIKFQDLHGGHIQISNGKYKLYFSCRGGGRIEHNYQGHKCFIYGYSQAFGSVDHTIAQKLVSQALHYPLNEITTSPQGY